MSLTDKLRELAELQTKLRSETCMGVPWADRDRAFRDACTLTGFAALLTEAERLEAQNARLRERLHEQTMATQESSQRCHDDVLKVIQRHLPEGVSPQGHPIEQLVGTVIHSMEAQNARLRELVRSAYTEPWGELSPNEYREEYWETSAARAALDALDKEGADASQGH